MPEQNVKDREMRALSQWLYFPACRQGELTRPPSGASGIRSQNTHSADPPQEIQLLQEPQLLPLQTLRHAVHFPEEEANSSGE